MTLPTIMAYLQQSMAQQQTAIADLQAQIETINSHQQTEHQGLANNPILSRTSEIVQILWLRTLVGLIACLPLSIPQAYKGH